MDARKSIGHVGEICRGLWVVVVVGFSNFSFRYNEDPIIFDATEVFVEAGDWFVHQMVHGKSTMSSAPPDSSSNSSNNHDNDHNDHNMVLHRASCQAGFKGCWGGPLDGFPSANTWNKASKDGLFGTRLR